MSHNEQRALIAVVKQHLPRFFAGTRVLEVGSLDINGSIRSNFEGCDYTGIDVGDGAGVDRVVAGQLADYPTGAFDVTISFECVEHNPWWRETLANMLRMTREGGLIIMTCAGPGRPEHGTTRTNPKLSPHTVEWDYYANVSPGNIRDALPLDLWLGDCVIGSNWDSHDTYMVGLRRPAEVSLTALRRDLEGLTRPKTRYARANRLGWQLGGEFGSGVVRNLRRRMA